MASLQLSTNADMLIVRLRRRLSRLDASRGANREALLRVGLFLENQIKLEIRRQGLIDTGTLLNSIRHRIRRDGEQSVIEAGSFGNAASYAAIHEFGFNGIQNIGAHKRRQTVAFGRPISPVVVDVVAHTRQANVRARPYIRPAFQKAFPFIVKIFEEFLE